MATPPTPESPVLVEVSSPTVPTIPDTATLAKTPTPTVPTPPSPISVRTLRKAGVEPTLGRAINDEPVDPAILEALSRKGRAGRRPGAVWDFFTPLKTAQNRTHATCNFCARRCAGVAARMTAHILDKCPAAPAEATEALAAAVAQGPSAKRQRVDSGSFQSQALSTATATTALATDGTVGTQQATVGLAAFRPHTDARNSNSSGLLLREESKDTTRAQSQDTLTLALHKLVVACLRRRVPLSLLEDEFFRDALVLLRPGSAFALKQTSGAALVQSVHDAVVNDIAQWMRASRSFTLLHRGAYESEHKQPTTRTTTQWRGADDSRHGVLLVERRHDDAAMVTDSEFVQSLLPLVGEETTVGVCSDSLPVLAELAASTEVAGRVKLWSSCLLKRSLALWSLVVQAVPPIASVASGAAEIASLAASSSPSAADSSDWTLPFTLVKRVLAMSQTLKLSETQPGDSEGMASAARSEFWKDLAAVDALLAPFPWLFVLGESDQASSSHFVLLWIWLLAEIETSPLVTRDQRESVQNGIASMLQSSMQDHHLVALLLDPRLCGVGLSATGRRKVKGLVVQVAARLWPNVYTESQAGGLDTKLARQSLLTQLGHYLDKSAYFADEVAWEMAQGSPPETFWKDYAKDAPELTKVAMAVLTFVPVSTQVTSAREPTASEEDEPFLIRQTRFHFERNRKNGEHDVTALLAKHSEVLAPIVSIDTMLPTTAPPTASSVTETKTASASSANGLAEAVGNELERVRSLTGPDRTASNITPDGHAAALEMSWFAFETDADGLAIKTALRQLVPPALLSRPAKPVTDFTTVLLV